MVTPISRPEAAMAFGTFAETQWKALVLPTLKLSTQHGYKNVLRTHLLPYWRGWRLRDIGRMDVQQWVAAKFRQGHGWQTVRNSGCCYPASWRRRWNTGTSATIPRGA